MKLRIAIPLILAGVIHLAQCSSHSNDLKRNLLLLSQTWYRDITLSNTYDSSKIYNYFLLDTSFNTNLTYNLDLGNNTKDVYFVFTNVNLADGTTYPKFNSENPASPQNLAPTTADTNPAKPDPAAGIFSGPGGKREISEFNRKPYAFLNKINPVNMLLNIIPPSQPSFASVGNTYSFYMSTDTSSITPATCRKVVTDGSKTLNIWVANNCWIGGSKAKLVDQIIVDALADKFLKSGSNNDIYDWVTNIFGPEWGSHSQTDLIGTTNEINILLCDIDNDNQPGQSGVSLTLGYFWGKDNFTNAAVPGSNQRIMFYIDALILATADGGWDITDTWPSLIISTLAHEFQHMIHFYQKAVLRADGTGSETWIDEMCSMATEDLVSDKLGTTGPRGVSSSDPTAGSPGNTSGWLPLFNHYNEYSPLAWYSSPYTGVSYALNYALGAYLARNYGGADFFRGVVQNSETGYKAIEYALAAHGSADNFGAILRKWSVANLLSDLTSVDSAYRYNSGTWFTSNTNPVTTPYNLGSINLYNYRYSSLDGPYIYTAMPSMAMQPATNIYYRAGSSLTGSHTWHISMTGSTRMTVVVKN